MFVPEVKSFTLQKVKNQNGQDGVLINFRGGEDPLKSGLIGSIVVSPQVLRGLITLLMKFSDENQDFFGGTNPIKDLGVNPSPEDLAK